MLKRLVSKRFEKLGSVSWTTIFNEIPDLTGIQLLVDMVLTFPPTSVSCETSFSQMKLIKTSRRSRLTSTTLNNLMMVKLESPSIADFDPDSAVEKWIMAPVQGRRLHYKRRHRPAPTEQVLLQEEQSDTRIIPVEQEEEEEEDYDYDSDIDIQQFNKAFGGDPADSDYCSDYEDEEENAKQINRFSREFMN